jgi:heptosyltransferase-2
MRVGIFLPNWVGDVVMATPALRSLRKHLGSDGTLVGIMRPYVADVLQGTSWFDQRMLYERRSWSGMRSLVTRLRAERFDAILLLTNSLSTGLFAWLSGARRRVGFALHGRRWLLTDRLQEPRENGQRIPRSAVDHYLEVVQAFGCAEGSRAMELATTLEEERAAQQVWNQFGWQSHEPVIALNTGGAYGSAKTWPGDRAAELARKLAERYAVLFLCGPSERESVRTMCQHANHPRVRSLVDQPLSLGLTKGCLRRCHALVTTDSGPRHIAAAFGIPTVTLFGPTDPRWSHNYHTSGIDLQLEMSCSPCGQRTCPQKHHRCMRDLRVEHVSAVLQSLLSASSSTERAA